VFRDDDRALHRDAMSLELFVVRRHAVVHEDQRRGDISINRVRVVRRQLLVMLARGGITSDSWLLQLRLEARRRHELNDALFGGREQYVEVLDLGLPAE